jgi:hypothetical protein
MATGNPSSGSPGAVVSANGLESAPVSTAIATLSRPWDAARGIQGLTPLHQASDGGHHLGSHLVRPAFGGAFVHAVPGVAVKQTEGHLVQGGLDGGDLGEHVDAVPVVVDHPLDPADLSLDAS